MRSERHGAIGRGQHDARPGLLVPVSARHDAHVSGGRRPSGGAGQPTREPAKAGQGADGGPRAGGAPGGTHRLREDGLVQQGAVQGGAIGPGSLPRGAPLLLEGEQAHAVLPVLQVQWAEAVVPEGIHDPVQVVLHAQEVVVLVRVSLRRAK